MLRIAFFVIGINCIATAQNLCRQPAESPLTFWLIYHPLEYGHGEKVAQLIATLLLSDSAVAQIAYLHAIECQTERLGPWFILKGYGLPQGVMHFLEALYEAQARLPQRIAYSLANPTSASHSLYAWAYGDTVAALPPVEETLRLYYAFWREGNLRCVLQGKVNPELLRAARTLTGSASTPQELSPPSSELLRRLPLVYVKWHWNPPFSLYDLLLAWYQQEQLRQLLCEQKQLACQFKLVPLYDGIELWIETGLPIAVCQRIEDFFTKPPVPEPSAYAAFYNWLYSPENLQLAGWWSCLWGLSLPLAMEDKPPTTSPFRLRKPKVLLFPTP